MNPFRKHDVSDFPGVLVPLGEGHIPLDGKKDAYDDSDDKSARTQSIYSVETLRAEVDADIATSGYDTAYDRM